MNHAPVLVPDITLLVQLGIFFACYFVMKALVFKPYLALLAERRAKTVGLKEEAHQANERAAKLQAEYETRMREERKKVAAWTEAERRKIAEEEREIIQGARDAVGTELQTLRSRLQVEAEQVRQELLAQVPEYSSLIATKLVGRKVNVNSTVKAKTKAKESEQAVPT